MLGLQFSIRGENRKRGMLRFVTPADSMQRTQYKRLESANLIVLFCSLQPTRFHLLYHCLPSLRGFWHCDAGWDAFHR